DQPFHSSGERALVAGFDEQMQVIRLHREVHHAAIVPVALIRFGDGALQRWKDELRSQRPKYRAQRHVHWMAKRVVRASAVQRGPTQAGLAPSALSLATPRIGKRKILLNGLSSIHRNLILD